MNYAKENWFILAAILYVFLPIDLIPDSIPILGNVDDTTLLLIDFVQRYVKLRNEQTSKS